MQFSVNDVYMLFTYCESSVKFGAHKLCQKLHIVWPILGVYSGKVALYQKY